MGLSERKKFQRAGPKHLGSFDWNDAEHCRAIAACLVQGVYVLENDRKKNRKGAASLAPLWWSSFNFNLCEELLDINSGSIFGAIFENKDPTKPLAPRYVVAFRGTIKNLSARDFQVNWNLFFDDLRKAPRFEKAMEYVTSYALKTPDLWLTSHSLGASMALKVGRTLVAEKGILPKTYLFNPPFASFDSSRMIMSAEMKIVFDVFHGSSKAGLAFLVLFILPEKSSKDTFRNLVEWKPILYVHQRDFICAGFIGYFKKRREMKKIGKWAAAIERTGTQRSMYRLLKNLFTKNHAIHIIPSATLMENQSALTDSIKALKAHSSANGGGMIRNSKLPSISTRSKTEDKFRIPYK